MGDDKQAPDPRAFSAYVDRAELAIGQADDLAALAGIEAEFLGRHSAFTGWKRSIGSLPADERKAVGESLNAARRRVETAFAERRDALAIAERRRSIEADRLDLTEVLPTPGPGHLHVVSQTRERLEDIFLGKGYEIAEGPEIETDWYNFTALNIGPGHPVRSSHDSFYIDAGEEESVLLRTHTSPVQIRLLERGELPIYAVVPGRAYRRDTPDATHLPYFNQIEALVVDRGITFGDLSGTIDEFVEAIFGKSVRKRLRPGFFPFTEPSAEFDVTCVICGGSGCRTCSGVGWIELGGSGVVHPAVFEATGVDPEIWSGFAFGFGIDRIAMVRHGVDDLRNLLENDVRYLTQF